MDPWTNRPDRGEHPTQLQILRTPPGKAIGGIITTADALGAYTHYWRGRTTVCTHPLCEACDTHRTPRWYGYLAIISRATKTEALLEITPSCLPPIEAWLEEHGTLRGADISLQRANKKINSRLICSIRSSDYDGSKLPDAPNVKAQLERIWEIHTAVIAAPGRTRDPNGQRTIAVPPTLAGENGQTY